MAALDIHPLTLYFGPIPIGSSLTYPVSVINRGQATNVLAGLDSSTRPNGWKLPGLVTPNFLSNGGGETINVEFTPKSTGPYDTTLSIYTDETQLDQTKWRRVTLAGSGVIQNAVSVEHVLDRSGSMSAPAPA